MGAGAVCPRCMEGGGAGVSLSDVKKRKRNDVTYCRWWWWCVVTGISMKGDGCRVSPSDVKTRKVGACDVPLLPVLVHCR